MKTISIWNVPEDVARKIVQLLREKAADMLLEGGDMDEVIDLIYTANRIRDDLAAVEKEEAV